MRAMRLQQTAPIDSKPLQLVDIPIPRPSSQQVRIRVQVCGVCLTDLHVIEGDLPFKKPIVPGHQVIGTIDELGSDVHAFRIGDRVGVAWLHQTCNGCAFCRDKKENLCEQAQFTGYDRNGGYADYILAHEAYVYPLASTLDSAALAPLLCAGIIGYRAYRLSGIQEGQRLGLYGFGASAHITIQIARYYHCEVYVFTRSQEHRELAGQLGAVWVGRAEDTPPQKLHASIIFAPAGFLVNEALRVLERGGKVALAGIHMSEIPPLNYQQHLYQERCIQSVTNNTRQDGKELLKLADTIPIQTRTQTFPLEQANQVLQLLKRGQINGAAVLTVGENTKAGC